MKKNIFAFFISSLVSLFMMEIALRVVSPPVPTGVGTAQTPKAKLYGWAPPPHEKQAVLNPDTGKPSFFTTNAQGWKDAEHDFQKPAGVRRILFIGDSNTWGIVPMEDGYTRRGEKLLNEKGNRAEVISIAVGGWGTDQELNALKQEGMRYHPDIVIYQFSGNDIIDNLTPYPALPPDDYRWAKTFKYELANGTLKKIPLSPKISAPAPLPRTERIKNFLLQSALVYNINAVKNKMLSRSAKEDKNWWGRSPVNPADALYPYSKGRENETLKNAWKLFEALVSEMKNAAEKNGARFLIFSPEGDEGLREFMIKKKYLHPQKGGDAVVWNGKTYAVDVKKPLENLEKICKRHHVFLIEPVRIYQRYENDTHPDAAGNERMAEDIADFLTAHNLLHS